MYVYNEMNIRMIDGRELRGQGQLKLRQRTIKPNEQTSDGGTNERTNKRRMNELGVRMFGHHLQDDGRKLSGKHLPAEVRTIHTEFARVEHHHSAHPVGHFTSVVFRRASRIADRAHR